ncbi:hypothetical protein AB0J57_32445 [Streptomyces sp. NPDC049837]|uniref:hypothetical protein n=1 Tax=Streptomyces sp. NPDC049837 TaxID=3155277 RepID=UPI0034282049
MTTPSATGRAACRSVVLALTIALTAAAAATPAAGATYVDKRANMCVAKAGGGCGTGIVVKYWYPAGAASQRGVGWVYASKSPVNKKTTYRARWTYKAPGKPVKAASGWKRAVSKGDFVETHWGRDGHTGPQVPKGTKVCIQFKGHRPQACVTLA